MRIAQPLVRKIRDTPEELKLFENSISNGREREIIASFPTVYIHNWKDADHYDVYIGESGNIFQRTRQHYETGSSDASSWQHCLNNPTSCLYIIGHEHFNKSLTLDVENRLMQYMLSVPKVRKLHNRRGNPQNSYYPMEELDQIFSGIWRALRRDNRVLFPSEGEIRDSAIFKASPLHKLTKEQMEARDLIIDRVMKALRTGSRGQLIFVEGEAGTGKTVLTSSTFYELCCRAEEENLNFRCGMIVNHDEQITVYEQIAEKLGLKNRFGDVVYKPTRFINTCSPDDPVDVSFVDEAHLLWTQGKQSYRGDNQLKDIIARSRVTVIMFDRNQILTTEQFWEDSILETYRQQAAAENNYIVLKKQMRMQADPEMLAWIDRFTKDLQISPVPSPTKNYCIHICSSPEELDREICRKAQNEDTALSRLIATYDWEYSSKSDPADRLQKYWEVIIGKWHKPWNRELEDELTPAQRRKNRKLAWAEQPQTIGEVGSTFTIQGFDLNYAGVILGPSVKYRNGRIVFDPSASHNAKAVRNRTLSNGTKQKFGEKLLQHEVRVLMTRGVSGLYIYACDKELRNALLQQQNRGKI